MTVQDRHPPNPPHPRHRNDSDDEDSHSTMSLPAIQRLSLDQSHPPPLPLPRRRPIHKAKRRLEPQQAERLRERASRLQRRVEELEGELSQLREVQEKCPHCHFYLQEPTASIRPQGMGMECERRASRESVEFEKVDFRLPLMYNPDLEEKSWVLLGTMLIAMGGKVTDMDGTVSVFKVVKEAVDDIRRQVERSKESIRMDFFLSKEQYEPEGSIPGLDFDPFYHPKEAPRGLELECVRVESVEQCDLVFDQKLCFNVRYDTLITLMEFMKENSSISYG